MKFKHDTISLPDISAKTSDIGRVYTTPQGNQYPSVTTFLGPYYKDPIDKWRDRIGHKKADKITHDASVRGEAVHQMAEDYVNNIDPQMKKYNNDYVSMFLGIEKILNDHLGVVNCVEAGLYSDKMKLAGRTDLIGYWDGKLSIIDYKTSEKIKKKKYLERYWLQATIYSYMLEELTGLKAKQLVLIIGVSGGFGQLEISTRSKWVKNLTDKLKDRK